MHSPFSRFPPAPVDPIFAVAQEAKAAGEGVIDATVGVILNEEGKPHVFDCVRKAAGEWAKTFATGDFSYPPLLGVPAFRESAMKLIFGRDTGTVASIAATGGTGALALNLKLLRLLKIHTAILPVPTWPNHARLLRGNGLALKDVPYLKSGKPTIEPLLRKMKSEREPSAVVLQACCHNPTGLDFSEEQWRTLAQELANMPHVVLLDLAYQGLGGEPDEDAAPVRIFREAGVPLLVAWSASKNHSVYGLRTGLACAVVHHEEEKKKIEGHYMILTREVHSASSCAGQEVVARVQEAYGAEWRRELAALRETLARKRKLLSDAVPAFSASLGGKGLFAALPLEREAVLALRARNVFLTDDGRINIAGIPLLRMEEFIGKLKSVPGK
ncbi:MAG: aminotransferase class I/II-fold pyridoxal phosphate-dependent enzyme [Candidatus Peribacteraceae bacterium]|nr:aminotransferase class I/II-fold pyridoxal phosphate-dependent enzyme [Candidatus Peribacteraceae bacterium]MDD5074702.1 aminotransferase class I/II-fold pyridoxal phosphate-dependent enzyme [Candidatus Peribacteraceae bacterium]